MSCTVQDLLEKTKKQLRSVLLSEKGGVAADRLERDYRDLVGDSIPSRRLGFQTLESLLRSLPEVCTVERRGGSLTVVGVASQDTLHIQEMVSRQNSKKIGGKRSGGGGGGGGGSSGRRSSGGGGQSRMRRSYDWGGDDEDCDPYSGFDILGGSTRRTAEVPLARALTTPGLKLVCDADKPMLSKPATKSTAKLEPAVTSPRTKGGLAVWGPRVEELLQGRSYGLFRAQVEKMYVKKWAEELSRGWVEEMEGERRLVVERGAGQGSNPVCKLREENNNVKKTEVDNLESVREEVNWEEVVKRVESILEEMTAPGGRVESSYGERYGDQLPVGWQAVVGVKLELFNSLII